MSEWISVKDRLPEYDTKFLVYFESGNMSVKWWWAMEWDRWLYHVEKNVGPDKITHWMPLPNPPDNKQR